jgi:hypothetical protein
MNRSFPLLLALLLALPSCGKDESKDPVGLSKRPLQKEHLDLVTRFADAVVRKDYKAAYENMAPDYKSEVGWDEFQKSISRYREAAESTPTYTISATEDDPKTIAKDSVVELFVPEAKRGRIVEEAAIHFKAKGKGEDADGFWALICWVVADQGGWKILSYYQDD